MSPNTSPWHQIPRDELHQQDHCDGADGGAYHPDYLIEAAGELERLTAENDRLLRILARLAEPSTTLPSAERGVWLGWDREALKNTTTPMDPDDLDLLRRAAALNPKETP